MSIDVKCQMIIKRQIPRHSPLAHIFPTAHFPCPHWQSTSTIPNWQTGFAKHSPFAQVSPGLQVLIPQRHLELPELDVLHWSRKNLMKDICQIIIKTQIPRQSPLTQICPTEHSLSPHWQITSTIPNWQTGFAKHSPFAQVSPGLQVLIPQRHLELPELDVHWSRKKVHERYLPNNN